MITIGKIAEILGGRCEGDESIQIHGASKIEDGLEGTLTFLSNPKYTNFVATTKASAIIVDEQFDSKNLDGNKAVLVRVENVYLSLAKILELYSPKRKSTGVISSMAIIDASAKIGKNVEIGHFTIIGKNVVLEDDCIIEGQVSLGTNTSIGKSTLLYPGVKVYDNCKIGSNVTIHANTVIGSDGFGFSKKNDGTYYKVPQIGRVIIENNVEIGANTVIDRGSIGDTIIKEGVILDNLIQIAHNVVIDNNTAIAAQAGIAGSSKIGKDCIIGGQVGIAGHIEIANGTMIQAKSGISSNVTEEGSKLYGYPALPYNNYLRSYTYFKNLPKIVDQIRKIELELNKLSPNEKIDN